MFATDIASLLPNVDDQELHDAIRSSVDRLLKSGEWASYRAAVLDELRSEIEAQLGTAHVRLCSSGSLAMELAFRGCGIHEGDEVICPALDYPGNIRALRLLGAIPVIVDTLTNRWTLDPEQISLAGSDKTKAVVVSHLYGEIADVKRLRRLCDERNWKLIEDACQMPGTTLDGKPLGSFGDVAAFSFGGSKPLTAGCGGAVVTNDPRIVQRIAAYGDRPSDMFAMTPIQAALLLPQWQRIQTLITRQMTKIKELVSLCQVQTPHWQWPIEDIRSGPRCFYKIPIRMNVGALAETNQTMHPGGFDLFANRSIRVGEPFRVVNRVVAGRGRIVGFANAEQIAHQTVLLDHRHLAGSSESLRSLADRLVAVHHDQALLSLP
jgi:perosamine synthetase